MALSADKSLHRVRPSLFSMLKTSMLMFVWVALFQKSSAVSLGSATDDSTNGHQLFHRSTASSFPDDGGKLSDSRAPFFDQHDKDPKPAHETFVESSRGQVKKSIHSPQNAPPTSRLDGGHLRTLVVSGSEWTKLGPDRLTGGGIMCVFCGAHYRVRVAMSAEGTTIAFAAYGYGLDEVGSESEVLVYKYDCARSKMVQLGQNLSDGSSRVSIHSVALSDDGMTIAVGSQQMLFENSVDFRGYVRVYQYSDDVDLFIPLGQDIGVIEKDYRFEHRKDNDFSAHTTVALSGDASKIALGPYGSEHGRVYTYNGASRSHLGKDIGVGLIPSSYSTVVSTDGNTVALGSARDGYEGRVIVYKYDALLSDWIQLGQAVDGDNGSSADRADVALSCKCTEQK